MNFKNRHFLTLKDYSKEEIRYLLDLAHQLKADKKDRLFRIYRAFHNEA